MDFQTVYNAYVDLLNREGRATCERVARSLGNNPATGAPYTRQSIRTSLSQRPEGRALIEGKYIPERQPIIVETRPSVLAWLQNNGFDKFQVVAPEEVTVDLIRNRYVYGELPISLALHARSIWLPAIGQHPIITDDLPDDPQVHLLEIKIRTQK